MKTKDKKIIADAEKNGTPIFVLTAKDALAVETITDYMDICTGSGCTEEHTDAVNKRITEFQDWQNDNSDKVKLPD